MRVSELGREGRGHTSSLIFETGDKVVETLEGHARRTGMKAAHFVGLGAFASATLAYFDWKKKDYVELLSLLYQHFTRFWGGGLRFGLSLFRRFALFLFAAFF